MRTEDTHDVYRHRAEREEQDEGREHPGSDES